MNANSRMGGNLKIETETAQLANGSSIEFYTFKWADLYRLNFEFAFPSDATAYSFNVQYIRSINLTDAVFDALEATKLYNIEDIEINTTQPVVVSSISYGIDGNSTSNTNFTGNGYGLYKFSVNLNNTLNVMNIYVAVFPSEIPENIVPDIAYYISTSTSLLTAYQFMISTNEFNYIESTKIHWYVIGESKDGIKYCLTRSDWIAMDQPENYTYIWETVTQTGQSFFFDSNGLEGNWTVYCAIDGTDIKSNSIQVTTTKKWMTPTMIYIGLGAFAGIILIVLIVTLIMHKKHEKIW